MQSFPAQRCGTARLHIAQNPRKACCERFPMISGALSPANTKTPDTSRILLVSGVLFLEPVPLSVVRKDTEREMICKRGSLLKYCQQETGCDCRTDNTSYVRTHCVHQQEVSRICLLTNLLGNTGCHRHCGYTGRTDQRIDLAFCYNAQDLTKDNTCCGTKCEGYQTKYYDLKCCHFQEIGRASCRERV